MDDLGRQQLHRAEAQNGHTHQSYQTIAQQTAAAAPVLLAVVIADQGLGPLGHPQHDVQDQGVDVSDDGVAHQAVLADAAQDGAVEQEDHHAVAQLRNAVGHADGQEPPVDMPVGPEAHQVEGGALAQEMGQVDHTRQQLRQARGKGRAPCAPVQQEDGHIVQHAVGQAPGDHRDDGQGRPSVGFHQDLHVVRNDEAHGEGGKSPEIVLGIFQRHVLGPQQHGEGLQEDQHQGGDHQSDDHQHRQILGKQTVGIFPAALAQVDGDDGAGAHGKQHGDGEHDVGEGDGQVDSAHGVFTHALGHEQAVHDGVQGEHHQGGHRSGGEVEELGEQTALVQHFG